MTNHNAARRPDVISHAPSTTIELRTALPDVALRPLLASDAPLLHDLVAANREHLTGNGDYRELVELDVPGVAEMLTRADVSGYLFGVFETAALVGVTSLVPVDPPRYGCGYWLANTATGRGIATEALKTLLSYAASVMDATDVFAGVTRGNDASVAVLRRAGFQVAKRFDTYTRYHKALRGTSYDEAPAQALRPQDARNAAGNHT